MKKTNFLIDVEENFKFSLDNYKKKFQSNHWLFNNNIKKKLLQKKIYKILDLTASLMEWTINFILKNKPKSFSQNC